MSLHTINTRSKQHHGRAFEYSLTQHRSAFAPQALVFTCSDVSINRSLIANLAEEPVYLSRVNARFTA